MNENENILYGVRGNEFKNFIGEILKLGKVNQKSIDLITDDDGMNLFSIAFTHPSADKENNYEYLEFLGDNMVNTSIVWYLNKRFPQLRGVKAVKIMTRLKIKLISKENLSSISAKMGMWKYVSASEKIKQRNMKSTLEDVFEAFFGAVSHIMDMKVREGTGYAVVYSIISALFDDIDISLKYEDLFDAKTRLKEIFEAFKNLGKLEKNTTNKEKENGCNICTMELYCILNGRKVLLGYGNAPLKIDAEQNASKHAIQKLEEMGYKKQIPDMYA